MSDHEPSAVISDLENENLPKYTTNKSTISFGYKFIR